MRALRNGTGPLMAGVLVLATGLFHFATGAAAGASTTNTPSLIGRGTSETRVVTYYPFTSAGKLRADLHVIRVGSASCPYAGSAGGGSFRCFASAGGIFDPCFAPRRATSGVLICPENPASPLVTELRVRSLPGSSPGPRTWAIQLRTGQVCVFVAAAWSGLGPFQCRPISSGILADCHAPVAGRPNWTAPCQEELRSTSPFKSYLIRTVWN
jgi:hypothetical protein